MGRQEPQLRRRLGLVDATSIALGAIVGAGVFVALGEAARPAGAALPVAILLAALVATCNGLSAAELGVSYPRAGGAYEFGYRLLHPAAGFAAGWIFLLAAVASSATLTLAFAAYLSPLLPGLPPRAVAVGLALVALAVNAVGVQLSRRVNNALVAAKIAVLLVFIAVGLATLAGQQPSAPRAFHWSGVPQAAALLFFAFTGYARPVTIVEELRDPTHDLPRAVVAALAVSTVLYLVVALVGLGLVGAQGLAASSAPLRDALAPSGAAWAQTLTSLGGLVATTSVLLTELWGLSRLAFAMARRGDLPLPLSRLTPSGVPRAAVLALGAIIVVLTATLDLSPLLAASSLSLLAYYGITNLAALRLRTGQRLYPRAISAAGLIFCLVLAFSLPARSLLVVGAALAVGLLYYAWLHCHRH